MTEGTEEALLEFGMRFSVVESGQMVKAELEIEAGVPTAIFTSGDNDSIQLEVFNVDPVELAEVLRAASQALTEAIARGEMPEFLPKPAEAEDA